MKTWMLIALAVAWSGLMLACGVMLAHAIKRRSQHVTGMLRVEYPDRLPAVALEKTHGRGPVGPAPTRVNPVPSRRDPGYEPGQDSMGRPPYYSQCSACAENRHHGVVDNPPVFGHQSDDYGYPWRVVCDCACQGDQRPSLTRTD